MPFLVYPVSAHRLYRVLRVLLFLFASCPPVPECILFTPDSRLSTPASGSADTGPRSPRVAREFFLLVSAGSRGVPVCVPVRASPRPCCARKKENKKHGNIILLSILYPLTGLREALYVCGEVRQRAPMSKMWNVGRHSVGV